MAVKSKGNNFSPNVTVRIPFRKDLEKEAEGDGRTLSNYIVYLLETHPRRKGKK